MHAGSILDILLRGAAKNQTSTINLFVGWRTMSQKIVKLLYKLTEPVVPPARWRFPQPHHQVRRRNVDDKTFIDGLQRESSIDELTAARVLEMGNSDIPQLSP